MLLEVLLLRRLLLLLVEKLLLLLRRLRRLVVLVLRLAVLRIAPKSEVVLEWRRLRWWRSW